MADPEPGGADLDKEIANTMAILDDLIRAEERKGAAGEVTTKAIENTRKFLEDLFRRKREADLKAGLEEAAGAKAKKEREETLRDATEYEKAASKKARETFRRQREAFEKQKEILAKRRPAPKEPEHVREKRAIERVKQAMNEWLNETRSHAVRSDFWDIMDPEARKELSAQVSNPQLVVMACARAVTEEHIVDGLRTGQIRPEAVSREFRAKFSGVVAAASRAAVAPKRRHVKMFVMHEKYEGDVDAFVNDVISRLDRERISVERVGDKDVEKGAIDGVLFVNFVTSDEYGNIVREIAKNTEGWPHMAVLLCGADVPEDAPRHGKLTFVRYDESEDNTAAMDAVSKAAHRLLGLPPAEPRLPSPPSPKLVPVKPEARKAEEDDDDEEEEVVPAGAAKKKKSISRRKSRGDKGTRTASAEGKAVKGGTKAPGTVSTGAGRPKKTEEKGPAEGGGGRATVTFTKENPPTPEQLEKLRKAAEDAGRAKYTMVGRPEWTMLNAISTKAQAEYSAALDVDKMVRPKVYEEARRASEAAARAVMGPLLEGVRGMARAATGGKGK
jgi:hypothetical protein